MNRYAGDFGFPIGHCGGIYDLMVDRIQLVAQENCVSPKRIKIDRLSGHNALPICYYLPIRRIIL